MPSENFQKLRIEQGNGAWSTVYSLDIAASALKFEDLHPMSSYVRQQDIARMHYARAIARGEDHPHIMTWLAMQTDRRAKSMFPDLDYSFDGENIISANAFVTATLRRMLSNGWLQLHEFISDTYEWHAAIPKDDPIWKERALSISRWLEESIQLDLYPNVERGSYAPRIFRHFDARRNFLRIGRCDFVRHFVQNHERAAAFNTSHFLHEHDDLISHHSGYGDAIGLMLSENTILRPPLYRRGCLLYDGKSWSIETMSLADIALILPGDICLRADESGNCRFHLNPADQKRIALYTRACQLNANGRPLIRTPIADNRLEFVIVNRQVVSWKRGGSLPIPQNGFILSLSDNALPNEITQKIIDDAWVEYAFADESRKLAAGIQAGPILLQDGHITLRRAEKDEEYCATQTVNGKHIAGITPVNLQPSIDNERKARTALGLKSDGDLILLVIDGCDSDARTDHDSAGATLHETAEWLRERGAIHALNLSGEGSAHLFIQGGLANTPSDRRGQTGLVYERMLPSIGIVV